MVMKISSRTKSMLTDKEKKIISAIQGDIPICSNPYSVLAESINLTESEFIEALEGLRAKGIIRRFGATLRHQKSGFSANAMVAWNADEKDVEATGASMAGFRAVSHCYRRSPEKDWKYNLYTMIHASDKNSCLETVGEISRKTGVKDFEVLFSVKELKKTSMTYFSNLSLEDEDD